MNKLVILSGVPGSGKSYFSKTIKKIKNKHVYIISSDELRLLICGNQSSLECEELMWKMFIELAKVYSLDKDGVVILDATHVSSELRVGRAKELKDLFDEIILVMWNINKATVFNQNFQREHPIPPEALEKFIKIFELPTEQDKEIFDKIVIVENNDITPAIEALELHLDNSLTL